MVATDRETLTARAAAAFRSRESELGFGGKALMWWTVLTVVLVLAALIVLIGIATSFRYGGKGGPTISDVQQNRFWGIWGQRRWR
jgi:hypothetical protein